MRERTKRQKEQRNIGQTPETCGFSSEANFICSESTSDEKNEEMPCSVYHSYVPLNAY